MFCEPHFLIGTLESPVTLFMPELVEPSWVGSLSFHLEDHQAWPSCGTPKTKHIFGCLKFSLPKQNTLKGFGDSFLRCPKFRPQKDSLFVCRPKKGVSRGRTPWASHRCSLSGRRSRPCPASGSPRTGPAMLGSTPHVGTTRGVGRGKMVKRLGLREDLLMVGCSGFYVHLKNVYALIRFFLAVL